MQRDSSSISFEQVNRNDLEVLLNLYINLFFSHLFSECTSAGSRRCHEKLGFECLHTLSVGSCAVEGVRRFAQSDLDIHLLWKDLAKKKI